MKKVENDWQYLSDPVKTILERIDINRRSASLPVGGIVDIPYFKGELTSEMANEIVDYQHSKDNEGFFSAEIVEGTLNIKFLKQAF